ncbi:hypothetical protein GQ44DRAFT_670723 [Phaeosphaeriaceae sp. PMI808]|nr:hypothetical protein GQ44DRAFT_670723 [Phaeosphaeriaceae sp. PMI808]
MHSIRRSCQLALRNPSHVSVYTIGGRRAFSVTSSHSRGALPVYLEPSTPELSVLLSQLNSKILLPSHLTKDQEKLVYRQVNKAKLEAEPVEITLGDVTLPLEHINRNQVPNRWKTFRAIVDQSKTPEDWENVVRMLEGLTTAKIIVKAPWQGKVVRALARAGMHHLILKAVQRPKATGLVMSDYNVLAAILRSVHDKAAFADWDKEETNKAFSMAKQIVELMENENHCGNSPLDHDHRGKPLVVALPTALAAVLAEKHGGDVDQVKVFAGRLTAALEQANYTTQLDAITEKCTLTEADFKNGSTQSKHSLAILHDLIELVPIEHALKGSRKVLGTDMPMAYEMRQLESRIAQVLAQGVGDVTRLQNRGDKVYPNTLIDYVREAITKIQ